VPGRTARKLLELSDRHGIAVASGMRISIRVPQGELASMVGASRENVNRALSRLITLGAVSFDQGHITILDEARLRSLC
jgi:CRP-like cAMP-binding protein